MTEFNSYTMIISGDDMKKIISVFLCLILCLSFWGLSAVASDSVFREDFAFLSDDGLPAAPLTFEATFTFPADMPLSQRGGVLLGNFGGAGSTCLNFEIHQNGRPRLYVVDQNGENSDIIFGTVNVYTGEQTHLAIVVDNENGVVSCYINGKLEETKQTLPISIPFDSRTVIGGDLRTGNSQYFKGEIENLSLYSDLRSANEIAADCKVQKPDTDNLIGFYRPDSRSVCKCLYGDGPDFTYTSRETFIKDYESVTDYEYSFAVIGDIQTITRNYPDKLHYIYDWIVENKEEKKIAFVAGLGDITDTNSSAEWELAKQEMAKLEDVVPYSFVRGNHDYLSSFIDVFPYGEYKHTIDGSFEETMLSTYHKLEIGGIKYLFLNLDLTATDDMLDWANAVISEHRDHNVIITTHIYLSAKGKLFDDAAASSLNRYGVYNYPDVVWDKLVSQHENISMVLCGHAPTDHIVITKREGVNGNIVTEILVDPQGTDKTFEATGMVAMLYFSDGGKTIDIEYYSTVKEAHFLAENQQRIEVETIFPVLRLYYGFAISGAVLLVLIAATATLLIIRKKKRAQKSA